MPPLTTLLIRRLFFFLLLGILVRAEENEDKSKKWNKQRGRVNKVFIKPTVVLLPLYRTYRRTWMKDRGVEKERERKERARARTRAQSVVCIGVGLPSWMSSSVM